MRREKELAKLETFSAARGEKIMDVVIAGGGINGAVTAMRLAHAGLAVLLVDKGDFAGETSQASSNLIWGGIKYLESFEFGLVRELCASRNELLDAYPSLVRELRFLVPHRRQDKHGLLKLYVGAWFYWFWGSCKTRPPTWHSYASLKRTNFPINFSGLNGGFEYSDAYLIENDARFVFNFIRHAHLAGANTLNYMSLEETQWISARGKHAATTGHWHMKLMDQVSGKAFAIKARSFVNATGPYVDEINKKSKLTTQYQHVFSKGIHLIVKRVLPDRRALSFYASDGRLFFAVPMGQKTCLGTTDTQVDCPHVQVEDGDRHFVLSNINALLKLDPPLTSKDIIAERCGVRPLATAQRNNVHNKGHKGEEEKAWFSLSRHHVIEIDKNRHALSIFGGKLTSCLNVAAKAYDEIVKFLALPKRGATRKKLGKHKWFGEALPGEKIAFMKRAKKILSAKVRDRFWRRYDRDAYKLLERLEELLRLGDEKERRREWERLMTALVPDGDILVVEAEYSFAEEMVVRREDFWRRRTMLALTHATDEFKDHPILRSLEAKLPRFVRG